MVVPACLTRKTKPTRVRAQSRGLETSVTLKWVNKSFTLTERNDRSGIWEKNP